MLKIRKKLLAFSMLGALLLVVGGFCNPAETLAATKKVSTHVVDDCQDGSSGKSDLNQTLPLQEQSMMICCLERPEKTPTVSVLEISGMTKIAIVQNSILYDNVKLIGEDNLINSSDSYPPKPDILSSVVKIE